MTPNRFIHAVLCLALMPLAMSASAQVAAPPNAINFQGRLATPSGNPVPDGTYSLRFRFYDAATAGNLVYEKTVASVVVKNGTFAVLIDGFSADKFNGNTWLGITVGGDAELAPRTQVISTPYALKSNLALTVPDGSINTAQLAANAVTSAKIADASVTTAKLADSSITTAKIAANAVANTDLASDASSFSKVSGGAFSSLNGHLNLGIGKTLALNSGESFTFDGKSLSYNGIGWFSDTWNIFGATAWLSGYSGIRFFTGGRVSLNITQQNDIGIGTPAPKGKLHNTGSYYGQGDIRLHAAEGDRQDGTAFVQARDDSSTSKIGLTLRTKSGDTLYDAVQIAPLGRVAISTDFYASSRLSIEGNGYQYAVGTFGDMIAHAFVVSSDARLKDQIATVPDALSTLLGLRGVTYNWNRNAPKSLAANQGKQYGFLAQEVETVLPELVQSGLNGYKAVNYMGVIPVAVEAIKTLNARTILLQKQIDILTARLKSADALGARMEAIEAENRQMKAILQEMAQKGEHLGTNARR